MGVLIKGFLEGDVCNRLGCSGVIEVQEKEGCCNCHINAPCSYCTTQTEYCPKCGWSAEEEQHSYEDECRQQYSTTHNAYKTDRERFNELPDNEFGYIHMVSGSSSITFLKGKHNGLTREEIFRRVGCADKYSMARMEMYDDKEFELTYFND
mgnify:FL=1